MEQPKKAKKWLWPVLGGICLAVGLTCYALDIPHIRVEKGEGHLSIIIGTPPTEVDEQMPAANLPTQDMSSAPSVEQMSDDALLGLTVRDIPLRAQLFYHLPMGPCVTGVDPMSDCGKKGIRAGDIVTALAGERVETVAELVLIRDQFAAGDIVTMHIFRAGEVREFSVRLDAPKGKEQ